ncbi:hypothetical protein P3T73_01160 [Kiritimatiellota bacterium B12222]|nr:hypothetical protein P3T73_01160 [Kiritimatiellota bacterium B12222]
MKKWNIIFILLFSGPLLAQNGVYRIEGNLEVTESSTFLGPINVGAGDPFGVLTVHYEGSIGPNYMTDPEALDRGAIVVNNEQWAGGQKLAIDSNQIIGSNDLNIGAGRDLNFQTSGASRMTIKKNGLIGIGTSNPQSLLHALGSSFPRIRIEATNKSVHNGASLWLMAPAVDESQRVTALKHGLEPDLINSYFAIMQMRSDGKWLATIADYSYKNHTWRFKPNSKSTLEISENAITMKRPVVISQGATITNGLTADAITLGGVEITEWPTVENLLDEEGDLVIAGAVSAADGIVLTDTAEAEEGAIRWSGTDFEGYDGESWVSLTSQNDPAPDLVQGDISMGVFN